MDKLRKLSIELMSKYVNFIGIDRLIGTKNTSVIYNALQKEILERLSSINKNGIEALEAYVDHNSVFQKYNDKEKITRKFSINPIKTNIIYHYTDIDVLKKLVDKRQFYMGSAYYMNDPLEIKYTYDCSQRILKQLEASEEELKAFNKDMERKIFDSYIWSFSANKNNQALNNYGELAIGIDVQKLQNHLANRNTNMYFENMHENNGYVFPLRVEYNKEIQDEYLRSIVNEWLYAYRGLGDTAMEKIAGDIAFECMQDLFIYSLCFKRPLLYQEEEIRFVVERISLSGDIHPDTKFNKRPVIIADFTPDMISSIIVSHKNGADKRIAEIKQYLDEHGFNETKVQLTDMPY